MLDHHIGQALVNGLKPGPQPRQIKGDARGRINAKIAALDLACKGKRLKIEKGRGPLYIGQVKLAQGLEPVKF